MSAIIMDSKALVKEIESNVRQAMLVRKSLGIQRPARLAILTDHSDAASEVYMNRKVKAAERCNIEAEVIDITAACENKKLSHFMDKVVNRYDGIILQLPVKDEDAKEYIVSRIPQNADVDGLGDANTLDIYTGKRPLHGPCTPQAVCKLLTHYNVPLEGKHVVIVGRSRLVGRPLAEMFLQADSTVTVCHSKTQNLGDITKTADVLVVAVGCANLITADMVKPGAAVIDVGINRVDGKLCGDVDFDAVKEVAGYITPVPGGVGPVTVATLMLETARAACTITCYH